MDIMKVMIRWYFVDYEF